ncbi:MAG: glycosyltransferase [Magnetococcus sp. WYHC-3]
MKVSIIITVLDSHEIVRRQLLYFNSMPMPDKTELVLIDDGSKPTIEIPECNFPIVFHKTNDFRPWTQAIARMDGVNLSHGDRLICVDIDHIVTKELIVFVRDTDYDYIKFKRRLAVLDENGILQRTAEAVMSYGVTRARIKRRGLHICPPGNCYAMSKDFFIKLSKQKNYDVRLQNQVHRLIKKEGHGSICPGEKRPLIYAIPNGRHCGDIDANPFGMFHGLSRETQEYKDDLWIASRND